MLSGSDIIAILSLILNIVQFIYQVLKDNIAKRKSSQRATKRAKQTNSKRRGR